VSAPIEIVEYDESWPADFERLRSRLTAALGPVALEIEHVGSTAVPGLAAKPKLDVDVVATAEKVEAAIERLTQMKRQLASRHVADRDGYTNAKSQFIERVLES
jgi:GrpB-like predicted nucleotidyltransferase (UPF0157 family)